MENNSKIVPILRNLLKTHHGQEYISVKLIKESLHEYGFYLLMILFSFPLVLPIPYPPGFTTIVGIPLLLFSLQLLKGNDVPWLPHWIEKRNIKFTTIENFVNRAHPLISKIESFFKPRMDSLATNKLFEKIMIIFSCLFSGFLILPLFVVNHICGAGILIMFLSKINKDGLMMLVGIAIGVLGGILAVLFIVFGVEFVELMFHKILG